MAVRFLCDNPECGTRLECPDDLVGKKVRCPKCAKTLPVPTPDKADAGAQLGDYRLIKKLGEGGMGAVYEAEQIKLERRVALKVLPSQYTDDSVYLERFYREAKAAAALNHANVVQVYDIGEDKGSHYFAMELVEGEDLGDRLARDGRLPVKEALEIIEQGLQRAPVCTLEIDRAPGHQAGQHHAHQGRPGEGGGHGPG